MRTIPRINAVFIALLAVWLVLTPKPLDPLFLAMGVASALLVSIMCRQVAHMLRAPEPAPLLKLPGRALMHLPFLLWLFARMVPSAIRVTYLSLHPRMPIEPGLMEFHPRLQSPVARALLANSITLVPGTMTVLADKDRFLIHAVYPEAVDDITSGELQRRVARLYGETITEDHHARWVERVVRQ